MAAAKRCDRCGAFYLDILTPAQCERAERMLEEILKGGTK